MSLVFLSVLTVSPNEARGDQYLTPVEPFHRSQPIAITIGLSRYDEAEFLWDAFCIESGCDPTQKEATITHWLNKQQ